MRMPAKLLLIFGLFLVGASFPAEACMPEPASVPAELKGAPPHNPAVSKYYLEELVHKGVMTEEEAERTQVYMIFRNARRQQDLKEVEGLSRDERRAVMKHKRELRGNALVEYANYCEMSLERARELVNLMHASDVGDKQYASAMENRK